MPANKKSQAPQWQICFWNLQEAIRRGKQCLHFDHSCNNLLASKDLQGTTSEIDKSGRRAASIDWLWEEGTKSGGRAASLDESGWTRSDESGPGGRPEAKSAERRKRSKEARPDFDFCAPEGRIAVIFVTGWFVYRLGVVCRYILITNTGFAKLRQTQIIFSTGIVRQT